MLILYSALNVAGWFAFLADENSETQESSAISDEGSISYVSYNAAHGRRFRE